MQNQVLIEKLNELPPHKINEVEDFIDFLRHQSERQSKDSRHRAISEYAEEHAGSDVDFDETLEQVALNF